MLAFGCGLVPAGSSPVVHMCWRRRHSQRGPSPPDQPNRYFCSAKKTSGSVEKNVGLVNSQDAFNHAWKSALFPFLDLIDGKIDAGVWDNTEHVG